ncbi:hypothetical protein BJX65DRAFT_292349 [Aspergillus insuetus]
MILVLNLVMVIWASTRRSPEGSSVLYAGDCGRTKQISSWVHVLINMLSTGMLGASHFAMQCLSAPAREDVDRAHAEWRWLDIGVPSVRNLLSIPRLRAWLWSGLVLSSVPLHLFYNSTVYSTISVNSYDVFLANSSFATTLSVSDVITTFAEYYNQTFDQTYDTSWAINSPILASERLIASAHAGNLTRLTPTECINAYATAWQSKYLSVALISSEFKGSSNSSLEYIWQQLAPRPADSQQDPYGWICQDGGPQYFVDFPFETERGVCESQLESVKRKAASPGEGWVIDGRKVDYCLAERTPEKCTLEYSFSLSIVVIVTNVVKIAMLLATIWALRANPLLTIGDAIASFLRIPDESSRGMCLLSKEDVVRKQRQALSRDEDMRDVKGSIFGYYNPQPKRRWRSVSISRWTVVSFMYTSSVILATVLLIFGIAVQSHAVTTSDLWTAGFAAIDTRTMISTWYWSSDLVTNSLIANLPHLIFSSLYFLTNGVLTTMALSTEWSAFAVSRKGLRVSTPVSVGDASVTGIYQRRARLYLSLPRRYSLPLLAVSGLLHWLMSQSIYLVRVLARDGYQRRDPSRDTTTVGWSPPAIVAGLAVGLLLPVGVVALACRFFKSGMPVVGSCSRAIAAACHSNNGRNCAGGDVQGEGDGIDIEKKEKVGIECKMLQWGVEPYGPEGVGHCAFSDGVIYTPMAGCAYR